MKTFYFPLETLLKVKHQAAQKFQVEVAQLQSNLKYLNQDYENLRLEITSLEKEWNGSRSKGKFKQEDQFLQFFKTLQTRQKKLQKQIQDARETLEATQRKAEKALHERKTIEKLKEKHYSQWKRTYDRAEHDETAFSTLEDT